MAYNKARDEQKWKSWKEREEEKLRELGMDEASIQILHESDWADFNSERRYREHQIPLLDYAELLLAETEVSETQIQSVEELLDTNYVVVLHQPAYTLSLIHIFPHPAQLLPKLPQQAARC